MTRDLGQLDAVGVLSAFEEGSLTPTEYAEGVIERAEAHQSLNALQHFDADYIRKAAEESDKPSRGAPLSGLPIVVKDNINTTSHPTTAGTRALAEHTPPHEAEIITQIKNAGGYIGSKAGLHELAFGITSNNSVTGAIRNPADPARIPGGSSGGTAAAIAAGIFPAGLGTDTGGSCRIPAALCGIVGFRPTTERYAKQGLVPISKTRDTPGPLARSVRDIRLLDSVMCGDATRNTDINLETVCLGVPRGVFYENLDPMVERAVARQLDVLSAAGAKLVDVDLSDIWSHNEAFSFPVVLYEVMRELPEYLAQNAPDVSFEALVSSIGSPDVAGILASQLGDDAMPEAAYRAALDIHRPAMRQIYNKVFEDNRLDAIVFPTTALPAQPIGADETVTLNGAEVPTFPTYIRNTDLGSNIGAPGISLPCPIDDGLPVGIEFDALPGKDSHLLALAEAVEKAMAQ